MQNPLKLEKRLEIRKQQNAFRELREIPGLVDFSSNDYLGFAGSSQLLIETSELIKTSGGVKNGSTGSRLLSGNHSLYRETEAFLCQFHNSESSLIFNSGYDANVGFFSSIPQREDTVLYDELVHASIRDGVLLGKAKAIKFRHNDCEDLLKKIKKSREKAEGATPDIFIVTESVFSMDGDIPDLINLSKIAEEKYCFLVIDEAHSTGVFGKNGEGLLQELGIENKVFARIITFGKAMGVHGAAILGSRKLMEYLVNFARSFIYTTALPPHSVAAILASYKFLIESQGQSERQRLFENIAFFRSIVQNSNLKSHFIPGNSAIQTLIVPGNTEVKEYALKLKEGGYDVKPILSPTVPKGSERLRICLHSFNTKEEMEGLLKLMVTFIK